MSLPLARHHTRSRGLSFAAGFCLASVLPLAAQARPWYCSLAPHASLPLTTMRESFGPSPTVALALGMASQPVGYRLAVAYTALHSTVDSLPGTVHHGSVTADLIVPQAFTIRRLFLLGGVGLALRRLHEGRVIEERTTTREGYTVTTYPRVGFDEPVLDLVARLGMEIRLWRTARWSLAAEAIYQASYVLKNPPGVSLDLRVDELIQAGLVVSLHLGTPRQQE